MVENEKSSKRYMATTKPVPEALVYIFLEGLYGNLWINSR